MQVQTVVLKRQPRRGDVYMANFKNHKLHWQYSSRPVVIVQNNAGNRSSSNVIVVPITSVAKNISLHTSHSITSMGCIAKALHCVKTL